MSPLYTDLLYSVRLVGEPEKTVLLYVLLEHQSSSEPWMLLRLLGYMVNIWTLWTTKNPKAKTLPYLLPVVLSNTEGGWKPRTTFQSLFEPGLFFEMLKEHIPEFSVLVDDLMIQEDEQIKKRVQDSFLALTLLLLRNGRARKNLAQWLKSEGATLLLDLKKN